MPGQDASGPEEWLHAYEVDMEHFENRNLSVVVAKMLVFMVCGETELFCVSLYSNPDLDDRPIVHA